MARNFIVIALLLSSAFARADLSLTPVYGEKYPNDAAEGSLPVGSSAWGLPDDVDEKALGGYTELIPYFLRSPNQLEAGSCLYMSLTGIAEFFLARRNPALSRAPDGPVDLSERYLMNIAGLDERTNGMTNWKTDSILLFNRAGKVARNADYRFAKGWAKKVNGAYTRTAPNAAGAKYGTQVNWVNELRTVDQSKLVPLPTFDREVLFADPASDQWNVGVAPDDIAEKIKAAMLKRRAPVHVIYNHFGYWHAVDIVGFDDNADSMNCRFTRDFIAKMGRRQGSARITAKAEAAFRRGGGCHPKGMFYVRDSIYQDTQAPQYDYDPTRTGEESRYTKTIVLHEYDWVRVLANHVTQIDVK